MHSRRLVLQSLRYYWRTHLGVIAGAAIGCAVLTGALIVGDSVKHTLTQQAMARIGAVDLVMATGDRFFQADLADRISANQAEVQSCASVLMIRAVASTPDGRHVARRVNVLGVDEKFFGLSQDPLAAPAIDAGDAGNTGGALVNDRLADQLQLDVGDELVLRVDKPNILPGDSVMGAAVEDSTLAMRITTAGRVGDDAFGRFSLSADQIPPHNVFVPIDWLADQLEIPGRANLLLVDTPEHPHDDGTVTDRIDALIAESFTIADAQLDVVDVPNLTDVELRSERIFIDDVIGSAVGSALPGARGVLTYFVNAIEHGDRFAPYSMITAIGAMSGGISGRGAPLPDDLAEDQIVINRWLADDLACGVGDAIRLRYFMLDDNERLIERSSSFTVRAVVEMEGIAADRTLMPEFPGIADADQSRDWEPGIPIDLDLIRDKDETYWNDHRGTPKAFVSLAAGQRMWSNRYGQLTAIRVDRADADALRAALAEHVEPASLGFFTSDIRAAAMAASESTTDFGGLFLALSILLIVAALLLTTLLFVFNIEQRARQIGTLLAVGYRPARVRGLLLAEGLALSLIGAVIGAAMGAAYTRIVLSALGAVWRDAVASAAIELHISPLTLVVGALASSIAAVFAMLITLRRIVRREPVVLLGGDTESTAASSSSGGGDRGPRMSMAIAVLCVIAAIALMLVFGATDRSAAMTFFGSGALLLVGGIAGGRAVLSRLRTASATVGRPSSLALATRNASRRVNRSLATIAMLACGVFLVFSVSVHQLDSNADAEARDSGTGGFAFIGETTIPVSLNLNEPRGRDAFGLSDDELTGVAFVPMRARDGDDASCLNLNLAQQPRLLGVDPDQLASRQAFRFVKSIEPLEEQQSSWALLEMARDGGAIPAIVDDTSATWALHKSIGDTIEYADESGAPVQMIIVGTIAGSILQGNLLIAEHHFKRLFPSEDGARFYLVDAPQTDRDVLTSRLEQAMGDVGLDMTETTTRLADYNAVQNTYLAIFQMLGGLGLLLGTVGLGIVVVRNVLERRRELALLRAVGFNVRQVRRLILHEHVFVLVLGIGVGVIAAMVAVIPAMRSATAEFPLQFSAIMLAALIVNGLFWVWLATRVSIAGSLIASLAEE